MQTWLKCLVARMYAWLGNFCNCKHVANPVCMLYGVLLAITSSTACADHSCCQLQAELHGVLPVVDSCFVPLQQTAVYWSNTLKQAVAVCNSLVMITKTAVAGLDVERSLFRAVEARFLVCLNKLLRRLDWMLFAWPLSQTSGVWFIATIRKT